MDRFERQFWLLNIAFLLFRLMLSGLLPLSPDEAYYWVWSEHLDIGYFDHPPMVAWWMAVTGGLFGGSEWAIRLGAPFSFFLINWLAFRLARSISDGPSSFRLVLALQLIPLFNLGAIILTPDTPLLLFWSLALAIFYRACRRNAPKDWVLLGLAIGFGLLSKYSMALFPVAATLALLSHPLRRNLLGALIAFCVGGLIFSPVIIWNAQHEWVSFLFQFDHATAGTGRWWENIGGFTLSQVALFSPAFAWIFLRRLLNPSAPVTGLPSIAPFALFPLLFFLLLSFFTHTEAGWSALAYPAAMWMAWRSAVPSHPNHTRAVEKATTWAALFTIILYTWGIGGFGACVPFDTVRALEKEGKQFLDKLPEGLHSLPILAQNYQIASLWSYYMMPEGTFAYSLPGSGRRKNQFDLLQERPRLEGGFIWVAYKTVSADPEIENPDRFDCAYSDEMMEYGNRQRDRFVFLICLPKKTGSDGPRFEIHR